MGCSDFIVKAIGNGSFNQAFIAATCSPSFRSQNFQLEGFHQCATTSLSPCTFSSVRSSTTLELTLVAGLLFAITDLLADNEVVQRRVVLRECFVRPSKYRLQPALDLQATGS